MSLGLYERPRMLIVILALILVGGAVALRTLPRQEDPHLLNRWGILSVFWPGQSAERVESLVAQPLEQRLLGQPQVRKIRTTCKPGAMLSVVELADSVNARTIDHVWADVRDRVKQVGARLPEGVQQPILDTQRTNAATMILGITWDSDEPVSGNLLRRAAEGLEQALLTLPGTEFTDLVGVAPEEVRLRIPPQALAGLGMSLRELAQRVSEADAKLSAGVLRGQEAEALLRVAGGVDRLRRIERLPLAQGPGGQTVLLGDIAQVDKSLREPVPESALIFGRAGALVMARVQADQAADRWAQRVRQRLAAYGQELGHGLGTHVLFDQTQYTQRRLGMLRGSFLMGLLAVVLVIFLSMGWQSAVLVGSALPLVSLIVLFGMRLLDIPIQQISITGLIIALGLLIDNAIVVIDELQQRRERGLSVPQSIDSVVRHLAVPLTASTLTTVLAFCPIALMSGPTGEFVGSLAISVILALVGSLALSLTVLPALWGWFSRLRTWAGRPRGSSTAAPANAAHPPPLPPPPPAGPGPEHPGSVGRPKGRGPWYRHGLSSPQLTRWYAWALSGLMRRAWVGLIVSLIPPLLGLTLAWGLTEQFFPATSRDQFHLRARLPETTPLTQTRRAALDMRRLLVEHPDIEEAHFVIGQAFPMFFYNLATGSSDNSPSLAEAMVYTRRPDRLDRTINELQAKLNRAMPQAQTLLHRLKHGPPYDAPVELQLIGPDLGRLNELGHEARRILAGAQPIAQTQTTLRMGRPEIRLQPDEQRLAAVGLTHAEVARQMRASMDGIIGGALLEQTQRLPLRLRLGQDVASPDGLEDAESLASMDLYPVAPPPALARGQAPPGSGTAASPSAAGPPRPIPLEAVGRLETHPQIASLERYNAQRINRVLGFVPAGVLPERGRLAARERLEAAGFEPPPGYTMRWAGEAEQRDRAVANLAAWGPLLAVAMATTLIVALGSFRQALLIAAVGLASVGLGLFALWVFDYPLGFMAIIGIMGLIGIAINDSIVVLAALSNSEAVNRGDLQATVRVVLNATRHVVSTTLTTAIAFLPLILWVQGGFWPPVAITIAAGVLGATLLALTFIPCGYRLLVCRRPLERG